MSQTAREATVEEYIRKMIEEEDKDYRKEMGYRVLTLLEEREARETEKLDKIVLSQNKKIDRMSAVIAAMAEYVDRVEARKGWDDV